MDWAGLLSGVVKYGPRQGWLLLLSGSVVVALDYFEPIAAASLPSPWPTVALVVAVVGAVILLICTVEAFRSSFAATRRQAEDRRENSRKWNEYRREALSNLALLNTEELEVLLYILREGKQRFSGRITYTAASGLVNKCIIGRGSTKSDDIWMVIDAVWDKRDDLIRQHKNVPELSRAPWDLGF